MVYRILLMCGRMFDSITSHDADDYDDDDKTTVYTHRPAVYISHIAFIVAIYGTIKYDYTGICRRVLSMQQLSMCCSYSFRYSSTTIFAMADGIKHFFGSVQHLFTTRKITYANCYSRGNPLNGSRI